MPHIFTLLFLPPGWPWQWYRKIWSDQWGGVGRDCRRRLPKTMVNSLGQDWLRNWMPQVHIHLWAKRFKQKEDRVWLFSLRTPGWSCCSSLHFPKDGILAGRKNSRCGLRLGWPGRGWQGYYYSLGALKGRGSEIEKPAILPKLCSFWIKTPFLCHQRLDSGTLPRGRWQTAGPTCWSVTALAHVPPPLGKYK